MPRPRLCVTFEDVTINAFTQNFSPKRLQADSALGGHVPPQRGAIPGLRSVEAAGTAPTGGPGSPPPFPAVPRPQSPTQRRTYRAGRGGSTDPAAARR